MATYNRINYVATGERPASSSKYNAEIDNIYTSLNDIDGKVGKLNVSQTITGNGATSIDWQNGYKVLFTFGSGIATTGETLGTGDGTTTTFNGTLSNPPVVGSSIKIYYTIGGNSYTAVDDGVGNLSGTSCSGTIDYKTGDWSLTFTTAPDNSTSITADYENGIDTLSFTAPSTTTNLTLVVKQDGTGYRQLNYPSNVIWVSGEKPGLDETANRISILQFYYDGTNYYGAGFSNISALTGDIDANGNLIKNLGTPVDANDSIRKTDLDNLNTINNDLDMTNHKIYNLADPTDDNDAINKSFLYSKLADIVIWGNRTNMPTARASLTSSIYNTNIYCIGGYSGGFLSTNEQYNASTNNWTTKANMPTIRNDLTSSIYDTNIYCIGGDNGSALNTNEQYNVSTDSWTTKANMPTARKYPTSSIYNTGIYSIGGYDGSTYFSINEQYNVSTDSWTTKANMPTARRDPTSSIYNTGIYSIGGDNGSALNTNEQYNVSTDSWTTKANMPTARSCLTSSIYSVDIYVVGGCNPLNTNEQYNISTNNWATKANMPTARKYLTSSIYNTNIYVIGGNDGSSVSNRNEVMIIGVGL